MRTVSSGATAKSIGIFRLWRDLGYAIGAILTGLIADRLGLLAPILVIGFLTFASSLIVKFRMSCADKKTAPPNLKFQLSPCHYFNLHENFIATQRCSLWRRQTYNAVRAAIQLQKQDPKIEVRVYLMSDSVIARKNNCIEKAF